jgi:hypothetical protein
MKSRIDEKDLAYLEAFPGDQKAKVMRKIMSVHPVERVKLDGDNSYEKAILKLRREGYNLIDVQRQEIAFSCIWYRQTKSLFNGAGADVAMLLWEMQERGGCETTVLTWRI